MLGPTLRSSDSLGLGCSSTLCIYNEFPGNADAPELGSYSEDHHSGFEYWRGDERPTRFGSVFHRGCTVEPPKSFKNEYLVPASPTSTPSDSDFDLSVV